MPTVSNNTIATGIALLAGGTARDNAQRAVDLQGPGGPVAHLLAKLGKAASARLRSNTLQRLADEIAKCLESEARKKRFVLPWERPTASPAPTATVLPWVKP